MPSDPDIQGRATEVAARLRRLEEHLGPDGEPLPAARGGRFSAEVLDLVSRGRTTEAARLHRDQSGGDLLSAIAAVAGISAV